jgi:hypothetical protein
VRLVPIDHLPRPLRGPAERVRDALLTDATALVILGVGMIARGISYSDVAGPGPSGHPAEGWLSMGTWAIVWVAVGVLCLAIAPWHRTVTAAMAVGAGVGLHLLWGLSFLWQSIEEHSRTWVSSIGYFMIVALVSWAVWRGSRTEIRVREAPHD